MRELERDSLPSPNVSAPLAIVGRGRVGRSLAAAAERAGLEVRLAAGAELPGAAEGARVVLLCVPDAAIPALAGALAASRDGAEAPLVGHVSGATTLEAVGPGLDGAAFSIHPLQTFTDGETPVEGTPCAIAGSSPEALAYAESLALALGMRPFEVPEENRAAYHAAASIASNLLVALEESAAELLERCGAKDARRLLAPLVLRTAANWAERGPAALTGPIARGDRETVERQRDAIAELAPELLPIFEALCGRAQAMSGAKPEEAAA
jgi:predicted short-subunit dehydrogenase-like oxidoreductase (DUF2520 family)